MATVRTRLTSVGDELALVLDEATLSALGYTAETEVELRIEAGSLVIWPVSAEEPPSGSAFPASPRRQD
jgi:hypothetical protein